VSLSDQPIGAFLAELAGDGPAPGAGSGAAVALAIGLGCARKALRLTLKHDPDAHDLAHLEVHLAGLVDQALAGGEADMAGFSAYIAALGQPKDEAGRAAAMEGALTDLVAVGENLVAIGDEARAKLLTIKAEVYPTMMADVSAALGLIAAARATHVACVVESRRSLNP